MPFGALLIAACSPADAPAPAKGPDATPDCAPLPGERPAGFVASYWLPDDGAPQRGELQVLTTRGVPCPLPEDAGAACRVLSDAAADALWAGLVALRLEAVEQRPTASVPDGGARSMSLTWDGGACALPESGGTTLDAAIALLRDAHGDPVVGECVAESPPPPKLGDYADATPGTRHRLEVAWDAKASAWVPRELPAMPFHHATRLEWTNLDRYPVLDRWHADPLAFTFTVLDNTVVPPGSDGIFRATVRARLESVCGSGT